MKDKKAVAHVVEYMLSFTVFILIISAFFSVINFFTFPFVIGPEGFDNALSLSDMLIGNSGLLKNNSTDWEDYNESVLIGNLTKFGLSHNSTFGVLSKEKIDALYNMSYYSVKDLMNIGASEDFTIKISYNDTELQQWGANYSDETDKVKIVRIVKIYDNGNYFDGELILYYYA